METQEAYEEDEEDEEPTSLNMSFDHTRRSVFFTLKLIDVMFDVRDPFLCYIAIAPILMEAKVA